MDLPVTIICTFFELTIRTPLTSLTCTWLTLLSIASHYLYTYMLFVIYQHIIATCKNDHSIKRCTWEPCTCTCMVLSNFFTLYYLLCNNKQYSLILLVFTMHHPQPFLVAIQLLKLSMITVSYSCYAKIYKRILLAVNSILI